jgi:hypothetical protein
MRAIAACLLLLPLVAHAQVYSPKVLRKGQPDASDPGLLAQGIYAAAGARTPRERAEAVWRFFLTDGRFVKPGFWYHIAGWAYEEPMGEVLDPVKLLNSYGFGLCYQIAPLLESVWKEGGFEDARVWFLTGHTVAEVFYEGAYHHFDSDMMGYNTVGAGPVKQLRVASVREIEDDGNVILSKMIGPRQVNPALVGDPWYPGDVREDAIGGLAELFTTKQDNWLFPFERSPRGHAMDFTLRPGERLIRYFEPEEGGLFYLPYRFNGREWLEFPQEVPRYDIATEQGPHSQRDRRRWATGRIEYRPPAAAGNVVEVRSPYVIIDASFEVDASLASRDQSLKVETSTNGGLDWHVAGTLRGPHQGLWRVEPAVLTRSAHGRRTAVSGSYGYLVRFTGPGRGEVLLSTRIQLNPRTLPALEPGRNELVYAAGPARLRRRIPVEQPTAPNARYVAGDGQGFWAPAADGPADFIFRLGGPDSPPLVGFHAGGRFLDLSAGLAPDKFTAEVRKITRLNFKSPPSASLAWSDSPKGPFRSLWTYDARLRWKDGQPVDRLLSWPEVDRSVEIEGAREVYVRYRLQGMAIDEFRLAAETAARPGSSTLEITHVWKEDGVTKKHAQRIPRGAGKAGYSVDIPPGTRVVNEAVILECLR